MTVLGSHGVHSVLSHDLTSVRSTVTRKCSVGSVREAMDSSRSNDILYQVTLRFYPHMPLRVMMCHATYNVSSLCQCLLSDGANGVMTRLFAFPQLCNLATTTLTYRVEARHVVSHGEGLNSRYLFAADACDYRVDIHTCSTSCQSDPS